MLKLMRENAGSWIVKILLGIIILVFVLWGVGSNSNKESMEIATVNGEPILAEEYNQSYNMLINQMRQRFQNNLTEEMIEMLQVDKQALNNLIDRKIILQESEKLNLIVTDEELVDSIRNVNVFRNENGQFDPSRYAALLRSNNLTPESFEQQQKEALQIEKLRSFIVDNAKVSEEEMREWYNWDEAAVNVDYVCFSPESYDEITPSEEEIEAYYKEHGEEYKTAPKVKASYVKISPEDLQADIKLSEEEIKLYYDENIDQFSSPKTVAARHILIKVAPDGSNSEEAKTKINEILEKARKGEDFAELAKTYSEGPSSKDGGYLAPFKYEDMVPPFSDKAFSMNVGDISDPVETQFGWHIIKVEEVNDATALSIEDATPQITETLSARKAKAKAYDVADQIYEGLIDGEDLEQAADVLSIKVISTDIFARGDQIADVKDKDKFADIAFSLPEMESSDIEELSDGYYIIRLDEKIERQIPELSEVIGEVTVDLKTKMKDEAAANAANDFLTAVKGGADITEESTKINQTIKATGLFKRKEKIPEIGYENNISQAAFTLSQKNPLVQEIQKGKKGYYVLRLKERKLPDEAGFAKEKNNIADLLMNRKKNNLFTSWLAQVKNDSEINVKEGIME